MNIYVLIWKFSFLAVKGNQGIVVTQFFGCKCWTGYKLVWVCCCSFLLMTDCCWKTKRATAESCPLPCCPQRLCIYLVSGDYITQEVVSDASDAECLLALAWRELAFMSLKASGPILWNYCSLSYVLWAWFSPQSSFLQVTVVLSQVILVMGEVNHTLHVSLLGEQQWDIT